MYLIFSRTFFTGLIVVTSSVRCEVFTQFGCVSDLQFRFLQGLPYGHTRCEHMFSLWKLDVRERERQQITTEIHREMSEDDQQLHQCSHCRKKFLASGFRVTRLGRRLMTCLECNERSRRNRLPIEERRAIGLITKRDPVRVRQEAAAHGFVMHSRQ